MSDSQAIPSLPLTEHTSRQMVTTITSQETNVFRTEHCPSCQGGRKAQSLQRPRRFIRHTDLLGSLPEASGESRLIASGTPTLHNDDQMYTTAQNQLSSDTSSEQDLVAEYCRAWRACQQAALETQRHESYYGEGDLLSNPYHTENRHRLNVLHAAAAQDLLEISNALLATPAFPCQVHVPLPTAENLDGHMRAFRVTQQFLRTHIDIACSVLDTVEQDMARLTAHIETTQEFRTDL